MSPWLFFKYTYPRATLQNIFLVSQSEEKSCILSFSTLTTLKSVTGRYFWLKGNYLASDNVCHWVKSVHIRSFFLPYFLAFGLNTKTEYLSVNWQNAEKCGPEKLRAWTLFTHCVIYTFLSTFTSVHKTIIVIIGIFIWRTSHKEYNKKYFQPQICEECFSCLNFFKPSNRYKLRWKLIDKQVSFSLSRFSNDFKRNQN